MDFRPTTKQRTPFSVGDGSGSRVLGEIEVDGGALRIYSDLNDGTFQTLGDIDWDSRTVTWKRIG